MAHNRHLDLTDARRHRLHVHLAQLFYWCERIQQLCNEGIVQLFVILRERRLWNDRRLVVGRCIVVLLIVCCRGLLHRDSGIKLLLFLLGLLCQSLAQPGLDLGFFFLLTLQFFLHLLLL